MVNGECASPPWRGELRELYTLRSWGGLPNNEPNDEVCDATEVHLC
jgi:hypothetical protein